MKRHLIALAAATLLLGGCSGGEAPADADSAAPANGDEAGKEGEAKPNPWASDTPAPPSEAPEPDEAKSDEEAKPKTNPWAKDPPPGAAASDEAKPD